MPDFSLMPKSMSSSQQAATRRTREAPLWVPLLVNDKNPSRFGVSFNGAGNMVRQIVLFAGEVN